MYESNKCRHCVYKNSRKNKMINQLFFKLFMLIFFCIAKFLPLTFSLKIGELIGYTAYKIMKKRRLIVSKNLQNYFKNKNEKQIQELSIEHFKYLGKGFIEIFINLAYSKKKFNKIARFKGLENIDQNKGAILVMGHFTQLEIAIGILGYKIDKSKLGGIYMKVKNKTVENFLLNKRERDYTMFEQSATKQFIKHLKEKKMLLILPDQSLSNIKRKCDITFFNQPFKAITSVADIAKITKSNIYPCAYYKDNNTYVFQVNKQIQQENKNTKEITQEVFNEIEKSTQYNPASYFWIHNLFKKQ